MKPRQRLPRNWLITDERMGDDLLSLAASLPPGSGIIFRHHGIGRGARERLLRRLRRIALARSLTLIDEARGKAARVHDITEIRQARLRGARLLLVSPLYRTRSHPDRTPLKRLRAAALARSARVPVLALGGMDARRFSRVQGLGFHGWAGIDAWMRPKPRI